jgi:predicted secreted protein with PEFG-CTERM motif
MIAIAPGAFADHHAATVTNAPGSATPGCEETDDCFIPSTVTIEAGGTVTWENTDNAAHTATGGTPTDGPSGVFDSSLMMVDGTFSFTFDSAGTYPYFCMVHPWMQGTVIVEAAGAAEAEAAAAAAAEAAAAEAAAAEAAAMAAPAIDAADYINASGASVTSITANADDDSVIIVIDAEDDGELSVMLHSKVIKAFDDGSYFVLIDNEEVEFEQNGNNLTIPYEAGNERVEIVGSYAVPEFGTIAMIILAVAIVSIIAITAKTRTTLIPKL